MTKEEATVKKQRLARTPVLPVGEHTADDVLAFVGRIIEREPRRLHMKEYLTYFKGKLSSFFYEGREVPEIDLPACGTVACFAGWINVATRNSQYDEYAAMRVLKLTMEDFYLRSDLYVLFHNYSATIPELLEQLAEIRKRHSARLKEIVITVQ